MKSILALIVATALATHAVAAEAPTLPELPIKLGMVRVDPSDGVYGLYSVSLSGPVANKSEEIRFIAYWDGPEQDIARNRTTRVATVKSGKSKTLQSMIDTVRGSFTRFTAAPANSLANTELAKIGDIKYGGELRIVAESDQVLRFDYVKPTGPTSIRFGRNEVLEFAKIMDSRRATPVSPE